jgi:hypothetical protein
MTVSRTIRTVLRWGGLGLLFLVTLEACARLDDWLTWRAPLWGHYSHEALMVKDEKGIHLRPNARFQKWRINSHGFRGPEVTMEKPPGVTRIVVLGASETFGLFESEGMEFAAQMQAMLDVARPGRYQVLNAGCGGMTLPRHTHYYRIWVRRFEPDLAVIYPTPASYVTAIPPRSDVAADRAIPERLSENLRLAGKTKIVLKQFLPGWLQSALRERRIAKRLARHPDWPWTAPPRERIELFETHLTRLMDEVEAGGARALLATHAHRFPRDHARWTPRDRQLMVAWRHAYPNCSATCLLGMEDACNAVVRAIGKSRGVPVVDLERIVPKRPGGSPGKAGPTVEHFADFAHFTDAGARVVASAFVKEILRMERAGKLPAP